MLLTGADGRLGKALRRSLPADVELTALGRSELDITDGPHLMQCLRELCPVAIVNAAAVSNVDAAECDDAAAHSVNCEGVRLLALGAAAHAARLIHISTDYVFDGDFGSEAARPYRLGDAARPLSVYGRSKLAGERAVLATHPQGSLVMRSSWVYDAHSRNFITDLLARMAVGKSVAAATDQVGSPTWIVNLARAIWAALRRPEVVGLLHFCDRGAVTRHAWVAALAELAAANSLLPAAVTVSEARMADFPVLATRPPYSALDPSRAVQLLAVPAMPWREAMALMLREYHTG